MELSRHPFIQSIGDGLKEDELFRAMVDQLNWFITYVNE